MASSHWFRWLPSRTHSARRLPKRNQPGSSYRLSLEGLEDRLTPNTHTVTNLNDMGPGSLRDAINQANANPGPDVVNFATGLKGTIVLTSGDIAITDQLSTQGATDGHRHPFIHITSNFATRVFDVQSTTASITGLEFDNNLDFGGGAIRSFASSLSVSDSTFNTNFSINGFAGGAIESFGGRSLYVNHSIFENNVAIGGFFSVGGAIWNGGGGSVQVVNDTLFISNFAEFGSFLAEGGAIGNGFGYDTDPSVAAGTVSVSNCQFIANNALGQGGNAFGNSASYAEGGAIYNGFGGTTTVVLSGFFSNLALGGSKSFSQPNEVGGSAFGGAIMNNEFFTPGPTASLTVDHCRFSGNGAVGGIGGRGSGGGGFAGGEGAGGAIDEEVATMTVSYSDFTHNSAFGGQGGEGDVGFDGGVGGQGNGGGVRAARNSTENINYDRFFSNVAQGGVGGNGGAGGSGGLGGDAFGGDADGTHSTTENILYCTFLGGTATGGMGGDSGEDGNGGDGGGGKGGGVNCNTDATLSVIGSYIANCSAIGGNGGNATDDDVDDFGGHGGNGGTGFGGGICLIQNTVSGTAHVNGTTITGCTALGGNGGNAAETNGGNGGNGLGGGIYSGPLETLVIQGATVLSTDPAIGGNGGIGGPFGSNGSAGQGLGGGLFIDPASTVFIQSNVVFKNNHASTAFNDVDGVFITI
jgi:hypothetical protein